MGLVTTGYADLHLHTNHSDGQYSPKEIIDRSVLLGLKAIAIVDHDDIGAFPEAAGYANERRIEVIPGVELSVTYAAYDLHILAYCFDPTNYELVEHLNLFKQERINRAKSIVSKLNELGIPIAFDAVRQKAGPGSIGRPHVARVLVEDRHVYSFQEAFDRFIGDGKPANVEKYKIGLHQALELIRLAGGVCSVAHPGLQLKDEDLLDIIQIGVDGIETVHPNHNRQQTLFYRELAHKNGLLETGGSDFHGGGKGEDAFGKFKIPYEAVLKIKQLAARP